MNAVRKVILKNLDKPYQECMQYGMIGYCVPHSIFPSGYHCNPEQPLPFAGLASQKGHMSLHLMGLYMSPERERQFRDAWARTGKKLDMGKACLRFKKVEDLSLEVIAEAIRRMPAKEYIAIYEANLAKMMAAKKPATKRPARKAPAKKTAKATGRAASTR